jgi:hypothetical protein
MAAAVGRGCPVCFTNHNDIVFGLADWEGPLAHAVIEIA